MHIGSNVDSRYYTRYQSNKSVKYGAGFSKTQEGMLTANETAENNGFAEFVDYREFHRAWMSQNGNNKVDYPFGTSYRVPKEESVGALNGNGAVTIAESEDAGEFIGLTMVPEEGQSVTYGMRAMLSDKSTPDNPIVQVVSNLGGKKVIYNVEVNKVDPTNATQLEMFALLSYTDKMGITDGGTFGSHQQLEVYGGNASSIGYCSSLSGADAFVNERFDWTSIMEKMVKVYRDAGIDKQAEDCKALVDFFGTITEQSENETEAAIDFSRFAPNASDQVRQAFIENLEGLTGASDTDTEETVDYAKFLKEKINEIFIKIQNGDTEPTYQIGAQSFTEKEWEEFLDKFDSVEEAIQELMKEEQARKEAEEAEKESAVINDASTLLTTESTSCVYETADTDDDDLRYITWYTEEGIFCRKAGQTEDYEWSITFENKEQYDKVMEFIGQFPSDWNMRFAAHENFWNDFLNDEIDMDAFMEFINGTNKGVPDFSITVGDSMYVDKDKAQWAKYTNPLGSRFYTAEEMQQKREEWRKQMGYPEY